MKVLQHIIFIGMILIGSCIYIIQQFGVHLPLFINNYLNDILSIPIALCIILAIVRTWRSNSYQLSIAMIAAVVLYFSVYFEYYLPQHNPRYTADIFDIGCYVLGGGIFYFIQKYL